jgi:hypothetical protein|tara:strand:+ start:483 stop:689 length:207 start_codon:yes stop_codon:yes gene_type:complete
MKTIKLTDRQIDVLADCLIYMGTEWAYSSDPESLNSHYIQDDERKELRNKVRIARNIMTKLGYSKNNF